MEKRASRLSRFTHGKTAPSWTCPFDRMLDEPQTRCWDWGAINHCFIGNQMGI